MPSCDVQGDGGSRFLGCVWSWVLDDGLDQEMAELAVEFRSLSPESIDQRCADLAQEAARGDPVHMQCYAMALVYAGRVEDSSRVWWAMAQRHPTSVVAWLNLAFALARTGRPEAAAHALERARPRDIGGEPFHEPEALAEQSWALHTDRGPFRTFTADRDGPTGTESGGPWRYQQSLALTYFPQLMEHDLAINGGAQSVSIGCFLG